MKEGERFQRAFEDAAIGIALLAIEPLGKYLEVNPTFCRMTGYSREELLARNFQSITASQDIDKNLEYLQTLIQGSTPSIQFEKRYLRKDSGSFWAGLNVSLVRGDREAPEYFIVQIEDIDSRKRAEEALQLYQFSMENAPEGVFFMTRDAGFSYVNEQACRSLGYTRDELMSLKLWDIDPVFAKKSWDEIWTQPQENPVGTIHIETFHRRKDGVIFPVEVSAKHLWLGNHEFHVAFVRDITERRRAEAEGARLLQVLESSLNEIYIFDADTLRFEYVNHGAQRNLGYPLEQLRGMTPLDLKPEFTEASFREMIGPLLRPTKEIDVFHTVHRRADGSLYPVEVHLQLVETGGRRVFLAVILDITDRKRAEEALRQNENRLREAVRVSQTGIFDHDHLTDTIYWSPEQREIYGFGPDEPVPLPAFLDRVYPEDRERIAAAVRRAHDPGGDGRFDVEHRIIRRDGALRWVTTRSQTLFEGKDGARHPVRTIGAVLDITERKEAESALQSSESRNRALLDGIPDIIFRISREGLFLDANPAKGSGPFASPIEFLGKNLRDLMPPDIYEKKKHFMREAFESGETQVFEYQLPDNGNRRDYETRFVVSGQDEVIAIVRDITERRRAEEALRESSQFNQQVITNAREGIIVYDREIRYRIWNKYMEEQTGLREEEVLGKHPTDIFPLLKERGKMFVKEETMAGIQASAKRALTGETFTYFDVPFLLPQSGASGWNSVRYGPFRNAQGEIVGVIATVWEITERKQLEEQLRHAQKLEAVGQLAGGVAHEFNNMLTAIIGNLDLAIGQIPTESDQRSTLTAALQAARRAALLTQQLLTFSHRSPMDPQPQDLGLIAKDVAHLLRQTIDRRIQVTVQPAEDLWTVLADAGQMHQVVMNLCVNARDSLVDCMNGAAREPVPTGWEPRIIITAENVRIDDAYCKLHLDARPGEYVCLSVNDNGYGIDQNISHRIFEPFFTTKEVGRGTGLGLATVYGIMKQHEGWIDLSSAKYAGTAFKLYLPRTHRPAVPTPPNVASSEGTARGTETLLFVDDEAPIRRLGQTILEHHGYTVLLAKDGEEAIDVFRREHDRIKLVVLDLTMPRMSGQEVLKQLLRLDPRMRFLISSGHHAPTDSTELQNLGMIQLVPKPYSPRDLARSVRNLLDAPVTPRYVR
ncbi:MAG: PAS domain S-box protein [Nitrospirae bacterium]|nr:PAS domain S-box protein [Nitrospirota bacterium]